jgi:hypothetical protein
MANVNGMSSFKHLTGEKANIDYLATGVTGSIQQQINDRLLGTDAASTGRLKAVRSIQAKGIATNIKPMIKSVALKISIILCLFFMLST